MVTSILLHLSPDLSLFLGAKAFKDIFQPKRSNRRASGIHIALKASLQKAHTIPLENIHTESKLWKKILLSKMNTKKK
jgi:hypothetical protein